MLRATLAKLIKEGNTSEQEAIINFVWLDVFVRPPARLLALVFRLRQWWGYLRLWRKGHERTLSFLCASHGCWLITQTDYGTKHICSGNLKNIHKQQNSKWAFLVLDRNLKTPRIEHLAPTKALLSPALRAPPPPRKFGQGHAVVEAKAGSGKTSTIFRSYHQAPSIDDGIVSLDVVSFFCLNFKLFYFVWQVVFVFLRLRR